MSQEHNKPTVLVVDDIVENIDVVRNILDRDYDVKAATNGQIALRVLEKFEIDLILLDVMMPNIDGYEVCQRIKAQPKYANIPVIFLTAMDTQEDEQRGFDLGAVDYVSKPFSAAILKARVATQLRLSQQNRTLALMVAERTKELEESRIEAIQRLALAAEYRDNETGNHVIRVGEYSRLIGQKLGLSDEDCDVLGTAAPLHDVGKIGISDNILLKPGRLDQQEFETMRGHANIGGHILANSRSPILKAAYVIAISHHERWDGTGYPNGLKGEAIPLFGRIVALCDVFDALASKRPYKEPWKREDIHQYINEQSGSHFDPAIVACFNQNIHHFYRILDEHAD
jgi:putative two-component system response regulator